MALRVPLAVTCPQLVRPCHSEQAHEHSEAQPAQKGALPSVPSVARRALLRLCVATAAFAAGPAEAAVQLPNAAKLFLADGDAAAPAVQPAFAALLLGTVMQTAQAQQVPQDVLLTEADQLLRREWPYYAPVNALALQPAPSAALLLATASPALTSRLNQPLFLNFVLYCTFKAVARCLQPTDARELFSQALGERLLAAVAPQAAVAAKASGGGEAAVRMAVPVLLDAFVAGGYMRSYTITWGAFPSLPDVPGGVNASDSRVQFDDVAPRRCQLKLNAPADLTGGVALRAEEAGWWSRLVPCALLALWAAGGLTTARVDESYFQDTWHSPAKLTDKLLLALGDPLFSVDVPFTPDTLALDVAW
jgi:hypothetical protein